MGIRRLEGAECERAIPELATILADCVQGGASVGFVLPFTAVDAEAYWRPADAQMDVLLVGGDGPRIDGTVSLQLAELPNGRHRAVVVKLLVHSGARGQGLAPALMSALEAEARTAGRTTLVLDSESESDAVRLYRSLGWKESGSVPPTAWARTVVSSRSPSCTTCSESTRTLPCLISRRSTATSPNTGESG